jgi:hypothetical protein
MEISFTLWSVQQILEKIPFDSPAAGDAVHLDFSQLTVPYYLKNGFKVSIFYKDDSFPVDAVCSIYSPENVVTIVIIIKRKYEENLNSWLNTHENEYLDDCCRRRELYCHEVTHLIAIIRAYPSERSSMAREDFRDKLRRKFDKSINNAQNTKAVSFVSEEKPGESPSVFDKDHFRYDDDSLNYFKLYQELMFPFDKMIIAVTPLSEIYKRESIITFEEVAKETLVAKNFFDIFPEKLTAFLDMLAKKLFG